MNARFTTAAILSSVAWLTVPVGSAAAVDAATTTAAATEKLEALKVAVTEVKGLVQVRAAENAAWQKAVAGMQLDEGAEFRTGPRSSVTCRLGDDQILTLDRLGTVKIAEAVRSGNKLKTDVIMNYGRTHYEIEAAGAEHESTVRSPSSTLAVRGTAVSLYDQPPFTPEAESLHGRAQFRNAQRELRFGGTSFTKVANDKPSAADTALAEQAVDPSFSAARTGSESRYIADQSSNSAVFTFDRTAMIPVITNGPPPLSDSELLAEAAAGKLPGQLDVVLRWTGNANMDLSIVDTAGTDPIKLLSHFNPTEFLFPGFGLNHSTAGGTIPFDNRGGPNGGTEIAFWKDNFPQGLYGISAIHTSGGPALVTFNVFLNGKPLDNLTTFQVDSTGNAVLDSNGFPILIKNSQITRPVSAPSNPAPPAGFGPAAGVTSVLQFIPSVPALDDPVPVEPPVTFPPPSTAAVTRTTAKAKPLDGPARVSSLSPQQSAPRNSRLR